jgi:hypothetical protein
LAVKTVEVVQVKKRRGKSATAVWFVVSTAVFLRQYYAERRAEGFRCYAEVKTAPTKA